MLLRNCFKGATLSENDKHEIGKLMMMLIKRESDVDKYFVRTERLFKEAVSKIYHIDFNSHLDKTIAIGVSVLKTVCCSHSETKNPQICPICEPKTNKFSQKIPMIARNESSLKCRINQSIMNE